jgi:hypothetical protein
MRTTMSRRVPVAESEVLVAGIHVRMAMAVFVPQQWR